MAHVVVIGDSHGEHLQLQASQRQHGSTGDFDDDNWLVSAVSLRVSRFSGRFDTHPRSDDFAALGEALRRLQREGRSARWEPLEPWVSLTVTGGRDRFTVKGTATERIGAGNSLRFSFEISAASVRPTIEQIDGLLAEFPVPRQT